MALVPDGQHVVRGKDPLLRQRERTVDNLKRLYAVVFSLSFTNFVREIFDTVKADSGRAQLWPTVALQSVMLLIFFFTAAVFFFQTDRFLDIRYTMPVPGSVSADYEEWRVNNWRARSFAFDYLSLIFTLIPFMVMSFTMDRDIVRNHGIVPFYVTYMVLLQLSSLLLLPYSLDALFSPVTGRGPLTESEAGRYIALSTHWVILNSVAVILLHLCFWSSGAGAGICKMQATPGLLRFVIGFCAVAILRNFLDFRTVWPLLYLSGWTGAIEDTKAVQWLTGCWQPTVRALGFAAFVLSVLVTFGDLRGAGFGMLRHC